MGSKCCIPSAKPLLNQRHQKGLTWAKEEKNQTAAQWSKVFLSYETNFTFHLKIKLKASGGRFGVAQNPSCFKYSVKFPQSVMTWGAVSFAGVGSPCSIQSRVSTAIYQEEHLTPQSADTFLELLILFTGRTLHLPALPKLLVTGFRTIVLLCVIGQSTNLT